MNTHVWGALSFLTVFSFAAARLSLNTTRNNDDHKQKKSTDELVLLGTKAGPAVRGVGLSTMPSANLLDLGSHRIIVDCGLGVTRAIVDAKRSVKSVTHIFITHYHSDHMLELAGLLHTMWTTGLKHQVHVYGPDGLADVWNGFLLMMNFDLKLRQQDEGRPDIRDLVRIHIYTEGLICSQVDEKTTTTIPKQTNNNNQEEMVSTRNILKVSALRNKHPPIQETYSLKFEYGGKIITFSGDTTYFPPLAEFAKGFILFFYFFPFSMCVGASVCLCQDVS